MSIQNLLKRLTSHSTRLSSRPRPSAWWPLVEPLEDRSVPSFGLATNYDTSYGPRSADVGDFNGDGRADVVSATLLGIAVRLNRGNGTLAPEVLYPLGQAPLTAVVGDLNGDGKLDLAAATTTTRYVGYYDPDGNYAVGTVTDGHVRVMLGKGDGTFTVTAANYDLGETASIPRPFWATSTRTVTSTWSSPIWTAPRACCSATGTARSPRPRTLGSASPRGTWASST